MKTTFTEHMEEGLQVHVPQHIHASVRNWITEASPLGHFLTAVIENNLKVAVARADPTNNQRLGDIILFFANYAPADCWGYAGATKAWRKHLRQTAPCTD